ncbi:cuticle protein 16.8-like [Battus philenor]|uniref:cuticle protein 16.8-like n=1 Tax=Battus philenor TaxID=42288 RepID=UPI0035D032AE
MDLLLKILIVTSVMFCDTGVHSAPRVKRLSLAETMPSDYYYNPGFPGIYTFSYDVSDFDTGNVQFRSEERYPNGTVVGSYGYLDPFGRTRRYQYIADEKGYRVVNTSDFVDKTQIISNQKASTEPTVSWTRPSKQKKKKIHEARVNVSTDLTKKTKYDVLNSPSYYAID